jgi:hypothetical protein
MNERLRLYIDLDTGERQPQTEAQRHFVTVCRGEAAPMTTQERVYLHIRAWRHARPGDPDAPVPAFSVPHRDFGSREWDHYEYDKCK